MTRASRRSVLLDQIEVESDVEQPRRVARAVQLDDQPEEQRAVAQAMIEAVGRRQRRQARRGRVQLEPRPETVEEMVAAETAAAEPAPVDSDALENLHPAPTGEPNIVIEAPPLRARRARTRRERGAEGRATRRTTTSVTATTARGQDRLDYWTGFLSYLADNPRYGLTNRRTAAMQMFFPIDATPWVVVAYGGGVEVGVFARLQAAIARDEVLSRECLDAARAVRDDIPYYSATPRRRDVIAHTRIRTARLPLREEQYEYMAGAVSDLGRALRRAWGVPVA